MNKLPFGGRVYQRRGLYLSAANHACLSHLPVLPGLNMLRMPSCGRFSICLRAYNMYNAAATFHLLLPSRTCLHCLPSLQHMAACLPATYACHCLLPVTSFCAAHSLPC